MWVAIVIVVLLIIVVLWAVGAYNGLVKLRNLVQEAWHQIDTELRRRYDLIPNLVETVRGYASHERETFEAVTRARAAATSATGTPAAQAAAEGPLVAALRQLFAVAEAYPELKANQNFLALQAELSNTEDRLQTARRFYNANVREYNQRVQSFPSMIVARFGNFGLEEFFEVDDSLRGDAGVPRVDFSSMGRPAAEPAAVQTPAPAAPPAAPPAGGGAGGSTPPPPPG